MHSEAKSLCGLLDRLQSDFHRKDYLASDPLEYVTRFSDPWDQEGVAWFSALLAYGNVKQIRRSIEELMTRLATIEPTPAAAVRSLDGAAGRKRLRRALLGFTHRFNVGADLALLLEVLSGVWRDHGSLGALFVQGLETSHPTIEVALDRLVAELWRRALAIDPQARDSSFAYFLTAPQDGSCCKRWCMFLRWMGREDEIDPGLWTQGGSLSGTFANGRHLSARQLVIPLDTHTGRISQYLGLTERRSLGWSAALEVTAALRECDAEDPVRYDFALCRLGILDLCQKKYRAEICVKCQLFTACRFPKEAAS